MTKEAVSQRRDADLAHGFEMAGCFVRHSRGATVKVAEDIGTHVHYAIDVPNGEKVPGIPEESFRLGGGGSRRAAE